MTTIAIVGLGLMGASLAKAVRSHYDHIIGVTRHEETGRKAVARGVVDVAVMNYEMGLPSADIVVLAAPVRVILSQLQHAQPHFKDGAVITDLGSSKREIVAAMNALPERVCAVGSHPMCGKETSGLDAADAGLYVDKTWVICPTLRTTPAAQDAITQLAKNAGANILEMDAARHDAIAARISHLPYAVAAALTATVDGFAQNEPLAWNMAASGFRDTTRVAAGDVTMMLDILFTNTDQALASIRDFQFNLDQFAALLERKDEAGLRAFMDLAAHARRGFTTGLTQKL